jgi:hypothetical protein
VMTGVLCCWMVGCCTGYYKASVCQASNILITTNV